MRTLRVPVLCAGLLAGLWAQTTEKPVTNNDIESMLAAGLPESTIVLRIETAVARGLVDLDASSAALGALKQKGATERVLNAVLWAEPFSAVWKRRQEENRAVPDLPRQSGVYFKAPSAWAKVESFLLWSPRSGWNWYGDDHKSTVVLGSAHSGLQISDPQPTFYVREPASGAPWRIVHLTSRNDQRLIRLASSGDFGQTVRTPPSQTRDVQMTHVAGSIYTLRPTMPLDNGEYILCTAAPGGYSLSLCHGFGIQR